MKTGKMKLREMLLLALIAAMMVATQVAMAYLPNVHLVAVFVILAVLLFGWKALISVYIFVVIEALLYGFSTWVINYLYVWAVLALVALAFRKNRSRLFWAAVSGLFGLCFGALCSIPYFCIGGWSMGVSWWFSGIPYDLIHCVSNAVLAYVVLIPLYQLCSKLLKKSY